ncbi:YafY family transcriptional regulator [Fulvivirga sp. 29W222]|uniref:YafY family transcriptional regulator n=1 Tax=Fulvivirga marina TaxID=2494733 RepID=A0A937FV40_9BACT|nr:YafY family protein [Fulvivirga marina]MBL6444998.1 YafY family transcriptional regulator [Fulvivirga marina]
MNRIDRLSAILIQLQSKKVVTAQHIADRFEISLRTVYRDIRALEEAGVPIGAEAGKGYFLMEGYNLPPVSFTKEEAGAILMASKLAEKHTDKSIQLHFEEAMFKIKAVLKMQEKDYLENLEQNIEVLQRPNIAAEQFPDHFLADIQSSLALKKVLSFEYFSNYNGQYTTRQVEPLGLCYYGSHWHMIGFCRMRQDLRDFRTDRIIKLRVLDELYDPEKHQSYQEHLKTFMQGTDMQESRIIVSKRISRYLGEQKYYFGLTEEKDVNEGVELTFMTSSFKGLARWLLMFGSEVSIISPDTLKEEVQMLAKETFEHHYGSK